jgi:hypothetical protein
LKGIRKLEALRSLILEQERAAIAKLQSKFDNPRQFIEAMNSVLADAFPLASERRTTRKAAGANPGAATEV